MSGTDPEQRDGNLPPRPAGGGKNLRFWELSFEKFLETQIGGEWQEPETPEAEGFVYGGTASRYRCGVNDIGGLRCHLMLLKVCVHMPY